MVTELSHGAVIVQEKPLAVVNWTRGKISLGDPVDALPPQVVLRTFEGVGIEKVSAAELVITLTPVLQRFVDGGGVGPLVQMFRYVSTDGIARRAMWCGNCGQMEHHDYADFIKGETTCCRKCDAVFSEVGCAFWHTFGACDACRGRVRVP